MGRNADTRLQNVITVKKNPTDSTKLETKIIRKTQSTANQFDAETLTKALQAEVGRNADTRPQQVIVKKNPTDNTKLETKNIRKTQSTANQFDAETLTQAVQIKVERHAQTVSYKMLSLFVKEIPTDITKLETKIIKHSIHKNSISCRHNEPRSWTRIETKFTQSQIKHYHCSSKRFLYTSQNWNQKSQPRTQSTVKQSDTGTLSETMLSDVQRNARTFSYKM